MNCRLDTPLRHPYPDLVRDYALGYRSQEVYLTATPDELRRRRWMDRARPTGLQWRLVDAYGALYWELWADGVERVGWIEDRMPGRCVAFTQDDCISAGSMKRCRERLGELGLEVIQRKQLSGALPCYHAPTADTNVPR